MSFLTWNVFVFFILGKHCYNWLQSCKWFYKLLSIFWKTYHIPIPYLQPSSKFVNNVHYFWQWTLFWTNWTFKGMISYLCLKTRHFLALTRYRYLTSNEIIWMTKICYYNFVIHTCSLWGGVYIELVIPLFHELLKLHFTRQSPWGMAICLVSQSVLFGNGWYCSLFLVRGRTVEGGGAVFLNKYPGRQTP